MVKNNRPNRDGTSRILFVSGVRGDTRRYRTIHPYEQLRLAGLPAEVSHLTDPGLRAKIAAADGVVFHRTPLDGYVQRLVDNLKSRGCLVLIDVDDLVFIPSAFSWIDSPDFQDTLRVQLYQEEMQRYRQMVAQSAAGLASTEYLAERLSELNQPAYIHRNAFSPEMLELSNQAFAQRASAEGRIVLGYASGTPTHDRDFQVIKPALIATMQRYPQTDLFLLGALQPGEGWEGLDARIYRQPRVPWRNLPSILAGFDINLAPLVADNPFAQSKSEIKWMEAALVRVPTIATPIQAFKYAIHPGLNGLLAGTPEEWECALARLIEDRPFRIELGKQAYADVREFYNPGLRATQLVETLNKIGTRSGYGEFYPASAVPSNSAQKIPGRPFSSLEIESHPALWEMALYSLLHRSLATMLKQVRVYVRRWLTPLFPYRKPVK